MGICTSCGRENPNILLKYGTCQSCRMQKQQVELQAQQNRILQAQLEDQNRLLRKAQEDRLAVLQSQCQHDFVGTPFYALYFDRGGHEKADAIEYRGVNIIYENHVWWGQCRHCGIMMTQYEHDNCRHHWTKDFYFSEPESQCAICGFVKPEIVAQAKYFVNKYLEEIVREERERVRNGVGKFILFVVVAIIGAYLWIQYDTSETDSSTGYPVQTSHLTVQAETKQASDTGKEAVILPSSEKEIDLSSSLYKTELSIVDENFQRAFDPLLNLINMRFTALAQLQRDGFQSHPTWKSQYNDACNALIEIENHVPRATESGPYRYCKQMLDRLARDISIVGKLQQQALYAYSQGDRQAFDKYMNQSTPRIKAINELAAIIINEYRKQSASMNSAAMK